MDSDLTRALIQAASAGGGFGCDTGGGNEVLATWPPPGDHRVARRLVVCRVVQRWLVVCRVVQRRLVVCWVVQRRPSMPR